jgi:hypothetical protein
MHLYKKIKILAVRRRFPLPAMVIPLTILNRKSCSTYRDTQFSRNWCILATALVTIAFRTGPWETFGAVVTAWSETGQTIEKNATLTGGLIWLKGK